MVGVPTTGRGRRAGRSACGWGDDGVRLNSVQFDPAAPNIVATAVNDGMVRLVDTAAAAGSVRSTIDVITSSEPVLLSVRDQDALYQAVFSPDGQTLATSGHDPTVRLWDASGTLPPTITAPLASLDGMNDGVHALTFVHPPGTPADEAYLVAGGGTNDHKIRVWDVNGRVPTPLVNLDGTTNEVTSLVFLTGPRPYLEAADADGTLRWWNFDLTATTDLCLDTDPQITAEQWAEEVGTVKAYQPPCPPPTTPRDTAVAWAIYGAPLYAQPSTTAGLLDPVPQFSFVTVLCRSTGPSVTRTISHTTDTSSDWLRIVSHRQVGYINGALVRYPRAWLPSCSAA
jgi:WD40 repeat protein